MSSIVRLLHDRTSQLMDMLLEALSQGKLCIVDVSQMRGAQALMLSGLILRRIFDKNQEEFTAAEPRTIPTIAVVEEAQAVLNERAAASAPYVAWVKEGRKYDLGALLITQQPGSIPTEILSQGDNWFIFHLLSAADLTNVQRANAHFSEDLLSVLLNEPIPGQGVFWSSVGGKPYPISLRALSFERMYPVIDPNYSQGAANTFASRLRVQYQETVEQTLRHMQHVSLEESVAIDAFSPDETSQSSDGTDLLEVSRRHAITVLKNDLNLLQKLRDEGVPYGMIQRFAERLNHIYCSLAREGRRIATMSKPALRALSGERVQACSNSLHERLARARFGAPQEGFQLGEGFFYRAEIGRVGRQEKQLAPFRLDEVARPGSGMDTQVVQHDDLTRLERWCQHVLDINVKGQGVDGPFHDEWGLDASKRQASDQARVFPAIAWHRPERPLPAWRAGIQRSEADVAAAFIQKDQALGWEVRDERVPGRAGGLAALGGTHLFFLRVQPSRAIARLIVAVLTRTPWEASHSWQCCSKVAVSWAANCAGSVASKAAPCLAGRPGMALAATAPVSRRCRRYRLMVDSETWSTATIWSRGVP
jgi:hypothetical protein